MKITHIAITLMILLLLGAGYLLMESANDKKARAAQDKIDKLEKSYAAMQQRVNAISQSPKPVDTVALDNATPPPLDSSTTPPTAPTPPPSTTSGATEPELPQLKPDPSAEEQRILDAASKDVALNNGSPDNLTAIQITIKNLAVMARIKNYNEKLAFVEVDAGLNKNFAKGMVFRVRRDAVLVGKVTISDTIEAAASIADVDTKSIPDGVVLKPGDELVSYNK